MRQINDTDHANTGLGERVKPAPAPSTPPLKLTTLSESAPLLAGFHSPCDWVSKDIKSDLRHENPLAYAAGLVAYLAYGLPIDDMYKVAAFAASLHVESSEANQYFTHSGGPVFGVSE